MGNSNIQRVLGELEGMCDCTDTLKENVSDLEKDLEGAIDLLRKERKSLNMGASDFLSLLGEFAEARESVGNIKENIASVVEIITSIPKENDVLNVETSDFLSVLAELEAVQLSISIIKDNLGFLGGELIGKTNMYRRIIS